MKIYIDTNIYMDYFDGRNDYMRPLGEFAFQVFQRTLSCEFIIVVSSLVFDELEFNNKTIELQELFDELKKKNKVIFVEYTHEDKIEAQTLIRQRGGSFNDTLHTIIAKRTNVNCLVTRNLQDFTHLQDIMKISLPEFL